MCQMRLHHLHFSICLISCDDATHSTTRVVMRHPVAKSQGSNHLAMPYRAHVSAMERGQQNVTLQTLQRVAAHLDVAPAKLIEQRSEGDLRSRNP